MKVGYVRGVLDTKEIKNRMQLGRFYAEKQNTTLTTRY